MIDYIYGVLLLNTLEHLIRKEFFNHVIQNKKRLCITRKNQLLLYIKQEKSIEKRYVVYTLEMKFILPNKKNELMLLVLIKYAIKDIKMSMMYISLSINTCKNKSLYIIARKT